MSATIADIRAQLPVVLGPVTHGQSFIELRCYCDFEGHGRASEDWEEHWTLELPQMPFHWMSTKGWKMGGPKDSSSGMRFHGKTSQQVINAAMGLLIWWRSKAAQ
jgi:hypothetical protein